MTRLHLLGAIIVSIILMPWIPMPKGLPQLRPEWFVLLTGIALLPVSKRILTTRVSASAGVLVLAYLLSMIYGAFVMDIILDPRDFTVLMQPVLYFMIYAFVASTEYIERDHRTILRISLVSLGIAATIALIQFFDPTVIAPLLRLWTDDERISRYALLRATGTMGNANDLGFLMVIGFALALFTSRHRIVPIRISQLITLMTFMGVFASGSRTGMVCLLSVLVVYLLLEIKKSIKSVLLTATILVGIFWIFQAYLQNMDWASGVVDRVMSLSSPDQDQAWLLRVFAAVDTLPMIAESWMFGHGPAKAVFTLGSNVDNEYILLLYRHGIIGTISSLWFVWVLAQQKAVSIVGSPSLHTSLRHFILASLISGGLFAYSAGLFMSFRLFGLFVVLWTISACVRIENGPKIAPQDDFSNGEKLQSFGHAIQ